MWTKRLNEKMITLTFGICTFKQFKPIYKNNIDVINVIMLYILYNK